MIVWGHGWKEYDFHHKEYYFLGELRWEVQDNPAHPLHDKELRVVGWIPRYDDFILRLPQEGRYAYVHLTWVKESEQSFPYCEFLADESAVNDFVERWAGEG